MVLGQVDELQQRSQLLHMIASNSPVLEKRMNAYTEKNGKYALYYTLLRGTTEEFCKNRLIDLDIASCPVEVQAELRQIKNSSQPCEVFLERRSYLIKLELEIVIRKARSLLGQARTRCC